MLEILGVIVVLGLGASFCPLQLVFLSPFAARLLGSGRWEVLRFSLGFSLPLMGVGVAVSMVGGLFSVNHVRVLS